jgi:hypothetical protein
LKINDVLMYNFRVWRLFDSGERWIQGLVVAAERRTSLRMDICKLKDNIKTRLKM